MIRVKTIFDPEERSGGFDIIDCNYVFDRKIKILCEVYVNRGEVHSLMLSINTDNIDFEFQIVRTFILKNVSIFQLFWYVLE
jgi:hypothetical protein